MPSGQVLIGRRFRDDGPEIILPGLEWQMPQGGIDADENPRDAVMRELWEETGVVSADYLGETDWLTYEFPPYDGPSSHRLAPVSRPAAKMVRAAVHRPRRRDRPADAAQRPAGRIRPWRWERLDRVADLVVPFRRDVYRAVAQQFCKILCTHGRINFGATCRAWRSCSGRLLSDARPSAVSAAPSY